MPKITEPKVKKTPKSSMSKSLGLLRGFKDILPADQSYWRFIQEAAESFYRGYGFAKIDPPILEEASLFVRSIGKQTDIVEKEMFSFADQGQGLVVLRPEATASIARAYINHGMINLPQPVKLFYWGPMFRRERPQSGRQRQFHQFGFEILGDPNPVIDAQIIGIVASFFQQIGLDQISIQVNSIGCPTCRKVYLQELVTYYRSKRKSLCEDCKKRLTKNPLRLLDCKNQSCQLVRTEAPQIVDWLDEECKNHFMKVVGYLDELNIAYILNPYLVRGLDYYTRTVFEVWPKEIKEGAQSALCGGGRYDGLIEMLGGRPTPAAGVAIGIERVITQLRAQEVEIPNYSQAEIFLAQIGDQAKVKALQLFEQLRRGNIRVAENFAKDSLKAQLELANKIGVRYALILGQKEVMDGTILIRDMESGVQEIIDFNKTVNELKKKLANGNSN
ncbi:MAG: histidine--tRNA ligase [Patescibacteria group bacterium]|nr:histidine--tRNA ligase [Patescibacteria group bacterium]